MQLTRKDVFPLGILFGLIFLFFPDVFFAKTASLIGDHYEQHYPWNLLFTNALKNGDLPFWTNAVQCGFPIGAEGQISLFYLPQIILSLLLPVRWAYSYLLLIHFILAAFGTYLYSRIINLDKYGAFVASLIFLFGAAIGGAYYNITSLKTIAWFPWMLFSAECFLNSGKKRHLILITFFGAFSILAGYLQVAFYVFALFVLYLILRIFIFNSQPSEIGNRFLAFFLLLLGLLGGSILSFPQLYLTFQLSVLSNRLGLTEDYAYLGSMSPFTVLTLIFPTLQPVLRGNCLYLGIPSLVFLLGSLSAPKEVKGSFYKLWLTFSLITLLLALGKWGILYPLIIKITHFYSFRIPSKFVGFSCFGLSILCGLGFQFLFSNSQKIEENIKKIKKPFLTSILTLCGIHFLSYLGLKLLQPLALSLGEWMIRQYIHGRTGHPYDLPTYYENLRSFVDTAQNLLSPTYLWNLLFFVPILITLFFFFSPFRPKSSRSFKIGSLILLTLNFYIYSWWDIRTDFASYAHIDRPNAVRDLIIKEKEVGHVGRIFGFRPIGKNLPVIPSANILWKIEDIGIYTPLVSKRYHESIGLLGNVNDSNFRYTPTIQYVLERLPLLNFLNVTHLLSSESINHPQMKLLGKEIEFHSYLYQNTSTPKLAFLISTYELFTNWESLKDRLMTAQFDPTKTLLLEKSELGKIGSVTLEEKGESSSSIQLSERKDTYESWTVKTSGSLFFVVSETFYPGWRAKINGEEVPLIQAYGLFRAVLIKKSGDHKIEFEYHPFS